MSELENQDLTTKEEKEVVETVENEEIVAKSGDEESQESDKEINWRKFREGREKDRLQREEEAKRRREAEALAKEKEQQNLALQEAIKQYTSQTTDTKAQQKKFIDSLDPDDIPNGEEVSSYVNHTVNRLVEEAINKRQNEYLQSEDKNKLLNIDKEIKDFKSVCTDENFDYLTYHYPAIAAALDSQPDTYQKWKGVYETVKKLVPNNNKAVQDKILNKNIDKPRSLSTPGVSQTADEAPIYLDSARRQDIWKRMQRKMKGLA